MASKGGLGNKLGKRANNVRRKRRDTHDTHQGQRAKDRSFRASSFTLFLNLFFKRSKYGSCISFGHTFTIHPPHPTVDI